MSYNGKVMQGDIHHSTDKRKTNNYDCEKLRKGELKMAATSTLERTEKESTTVTANKEQVDVMEQLLKPEVQESLTTLVEQLPKLTEIVSVLTKTYDLAQSLATDDLLKRQTSEAIELVLEPVKGSVKNVAQVAIEAKERAEKGTEVIGLFGLLKMLKDPQIQKVFRFAQAYLEISSERDNKKQF